MTKRQPHTSVVPGHPPCVDADRIAHLLERHGPHAPIADRSRSAATLHAAVHAEARAPERPTT